MLWIVASTAFFVAMAALWLATDTRGLIAALREHFVKLIATQHEHFVKTTIETIKTSTAGNKSEIERLNLRIKELEKLTLGNDEDAEEPAPDEEPSATKAGAEKVEETEYTPSSAVKTGA